MPEDNMKESRAMQIVSVRFGADQIELIHQEASADGKSVSQFIRDAAHVQAVLRAAERNRVTVQLLESMIAVVETTGHDELSAQLRELLDAEHHHNA